MLVLLTVAALLSETVLFPTNGVRATAFLLATTVLVTTADRELEILERLQMGSYRA